MRTAYDVLIPRGVVHPTCRPRTAPQDAPRREPDATHDAEVADRLEGVRGTGWVEAAAPAGQLPERDPVDSGSCRHSYRHQGAIHVGFDVGRLRSVDLRSRNEYHVKRTLCPRLDAPPCFSEKASPPVSYHGTPDTATAHECRARQPIAGNDVHYHQPPGGTLATSHDATHIRPSTKDPEAPGRRHCRSQAASRARPLALRRASRRRPARVRIRRRNPCFFFRLRLLGWNVFFMLHSSSVRCTASSVHIGNGPRVYGLRIEDGRPRIRASGGKRSPRPSC
jgi:hypothetical protein